MSISFEAALGIHDKALAAHSRRAETLAHNIVNADTPGYKARDIDFRQLLTQAVQQEGSGNVRRTHPRHIPVAGTAGAPAELQYRVPLQPAIDGNTVELQIEQAEYAKNALRFQTSLTFLNSKIRGLSNAIRGD